MLNNKYLDSLVELMRDAYATGYSDGEVHHGGDFDWIEARKAIEKVLHSRYTCPNGHGRWDLPNENGIFDPCPKCGALCGSLLSDDLES